MHIHILGIAGTFMGGLAAIAREAGHRVTGCDANVYPPMSDQLRALDIDFVEGFSADQIGFKPDLFVIGNVVSRGNPLMEAILDARLPYRSGPQWLGETVLGSRPVLAIAGTHGKTTTTALSAYLLREGLQQDIGYLIGGVAHNFASSGRLGAPGAPFVIEADEYDTAFFDKRSKFVHYRPHVAVFNNLEYDHADIFPDLAAIETQFHHLVRMMAGQAFIVLPAQGLAGDALERVLARGCWSRIERFGAPQQGLWVSESKAFEGGQIMQLHCADQRLGEVTLALSGAYNRSNCLAALTAARCLGLAPEQAIEHLAGFGGVRRRMEWRGSVRGITVYDDFAHHPTAIEASLGAAREFGEGRVIAVVEPRTNTMKLGAMSARLAASLEAADLVFCYAGGLSWDVGAALAPLGQRAQVHHTMDALVNAMVLIAKPQDRIVVMSNGGFGGIHQRLLD
ncbi:MAG: UDP-N-acetylmuramate:L-alanyl-gamma-D-glutamyl-meso-diaminopimelate ligase, partial [Betaproteobacteria bacterium]|nr:UDP-N-acetylmuramate:L-alanyl-gamma-D-glutamyl-meso-diaminopimelate ligase [Betaproteobacteria bacterium]